MESLTLFHKLESAIEDNNVKLIKENLRNKNIDDSVWVELLSISYRKNQKDIINCIRDNGVLLLPVQMYCACRYNDNEFVSKTIKENKDWQNEVLWIGMLDTAHTFNSTDVTHCLQQSGRVPLYLQLFIACQRGDKQFVEACIKEGSDMRQVVDWDALIISTCMFGHCDVTRCIVAAGSHGSSIDSRLILACMDGDIQYVQQMIHNVSESKVLYCYYVSAYNCGQRDVADILIAAHQHALIEAVMRRGCDLNKAAVDYLIQHRECDNAEVNRSFTYLHHVSNNADHNGLMHALAMGSDVDAQGYMGQTALHMLCQPHKPEIVWGEDLPVPMERTDGDKIFKSILSSINYLFTKIECVKSLIEHKVDVNIRDDNGQSALHLAVIHNVIRIVEILLMAGSEINMLDGTGMSPVALASLHGHKDIVELLLYKNCDPHTVNIYNQNAMYLACMKNNVVCATFLAINNVDINHPDIEGITPLAISASYGSHQAVQFLLDHKANVNVVDKEGLSALHKAVHARSEDCLKSLLQHQVNRNVRDITGNTALHMASEKNHKMVSLLIEAGCDITIQNNLGNTALHVAVLSKKMEVVKVLLNCNIDINCKNNTGETPLLLATSVLDWEMVDFLMKSKADISATNNLGRGLIHSVVTSKSHQQLFRQCLQSNYKFKSILESSGHDVADVTLKDKNKGKTETFIIGADLATVPSLKRIRAVSFVSKVFNTGVCTLVLSKVCNINQVDYNGQSALHLAAESGNDLAVKFLLDNGADPWLEDKFGHMPAMLAVKHLKILDLLLQCQRPKSFNEKEFTDKLAEMLFWKNVEAPPSIAPKIKFNQNNKPKDAHPIEKDLSLNVYKYDLPKFVDSWLASLPALTYVDHQIIISTLSEFITDVGHQVEQLEPLIAFQFEVSGSEREKTKVIATNELDALLVLKNIHHDMFHMPDAPATPVLKKCVQLKAKKEYVEQLGNLINDDGILSGANLQSLLGKSVATVISKPDLWKKYPNLQRRDVQDVTAGNQTITALNLRWSDSTYPLLDLSIDLVPAILFPPPEEGGWIPPWFHQENLNQFNNYIAVPKWKSFEPTSQTMVEFGVRSWGEVFAKMPEELRQGYRMAKVVKERAVCPGIENWPEIHASSFLTSYWLKTCAIKHYNHGNCPSGKTDLYWAQQIYTDLEEAFSKPYLESYFVPGYNLLHDDKYHQYKEMTLTYVKLCRKLLTPKVARHLRGAFMGIPQPELPHDQEDQGLN